MASGKGRGTHPGAERVRGAESFSPSVRPWPLGTKPNHPTTGLIVSLFLFVVRKRVSIMSIKKAEARYTDVLEVRDHLPALRSHKTRRRSLLCLH